MTTALQDLSSVESAAMAEFAPTDSRHNEPLVEHLCSLTEFPFDDAGFPVYTWPAPTQRR